MQDIKYKGNYIQVTEENIHGHIFERVKLRKGVHVIPTNREGKMLLINEKRTHEDASRWKLVSGWVDKDGKSLLEHAQDELAEEVGFASDEWEEIYNSDFEDLTVSPSTYYFVCRNIQKLENPPENPNDSIVLAYDWFSFDDIFTLILKDKMLRDDSTLIALAFLYEENKKRT